LKVLTWSHLSFLTPIRRARASETRICASRSGNSLQEAISCVWLPKWRCLRPSRTSGLNLSSHALQAWTFLDPR
jgi:hypothetical protein